MRRATRTMRRRSLVIGNIDEQINSLAVVQTSGCVSGEYLRLSQQNDSLNRALCEVAELRGRLRGISTFGTHAATAAVLAVGLVEVRRGAATAATVVACTLVGRLVGRPVRTLGLANDYWHRGQVSRGKVVDFLNSSSRPDAPDAPSLRVRRGEVEFDQVTIPGALEGFTASVPARTIVALTGPSGSGKSTVLALLARLVEPHHGTVRIDGQDLREVTWQSLGRSIGIVSPELPLLRGTVKRNMIYRASKAAPAEIQRVAHALDLDETLRRHGRAGVRTWLTEGGGNVSASDRQLVKLARAVMDNPRVLLLDEPFAGLDPQERSAVRDLLKRYQGTVLMISENAEDIDIAQQVWEPDEGRLVRCQTIEEYRDQRWLERGGITWHAATAHCDETGGSSASSRPSDWRRAGPAGSTSRRPRCRRRRSSPPMSPPGSTRSSRSGSSATRWSGTARSSWWPSEASRRRWPRFPGS